MFVIVPVKRFDAAKSRLAGCLPPARRAALAEMLARTMLERLASARSVRGLILATSEPALADAGSRFGARIVADDPARPGLNGAVEQAMSLAVEAGAHDVGVVLCDLPLFCPEVFDAVVAAHRAGGGRRLTLVPDWAGTGTNVRLTRPAGLIPSFYGARSAPNHMEAAALVGAEVQVIRHETLSRDLDAPADVVRLLDRAPRGGLATELRALIAEAGPSRERQEECA